MKREEMIEQLENTILLIKQNGKDWLDERDIPILEEAIKAMKTEQNAYKEGYDAHKRLIAREAKFNHYCPRCMGRLESCEDVISRQAAISVANSFDATQVVRGLEKLPPVQTEIKCIAKITMTDDQVKEAFEKAKCEILATLPEQRWIPVSERLPEKDGRYWVAVEFKHKDGSKDYQTNIATLELRTFFVLEDLFIGEQKRIVAWMPYTEPEPFKAKSEE